MGWQLFTELKDEIQVNHMLDGDQIPDGSR